MRIGVARESDPAEPRVAATPETVKKLKALGAELAVAPGAGIKSGILDEDFAAAGAAIRADATRDADIVLKVRCPSEAEVATYKSGALVIAIMDPFGNDAALAAMAKAGITAFAMELMPRITRAQSMDVLSSQANLGGYRAVIDGAAEYSRALPMMMTAAGTVPAAKVFVMGAGVAGLQAIATARRLGAIVTATDVRPAAKEQVESLGAKFIAVEGGGNVEGVKPGGVAEVGGVKIVGHLNVPGRLAASASALYARNLFAFLEILVDKKSKAPAVNWDDEIVTATALTRDGSVIHPNFKPKSAA